MKKNFKKNYKKLDKKAFKLQFVHNYGNNIIPANFVSDQLDAN